MKNFILSFAMIFVALTAGCDSQTDRHGDTPTSDSTQLEVESVKGSHKIHGNSKENFLEHLKNGKELYSFFSDHWTLIYHEDNRSDGSTDGERVDLPKTEIDKTIEINLKNDGNGWANDDKRDPKEYVLNFNLKELIANWDMLEISDSEIEREKEGVIYIIGDYAGAKYLVLHYGNDNLIVKMEYRSEDPG
jgi:hypothetical protein